MKPREFIVALAGMATAGPLPARAQRATVRIPRIGIIDDDPFPRWAGRTRPYSITLWWLVRGCPTRVVGRTQTMFHNALVVDSISESQVNRAKQQSARRSG